MHSNGQMQFIGNFSRLLPDEHAHGGPELLPALSDVFGGLSSRYHHFTRIEAEEDYRGGVRAVYQAREHRLLIHAVQLEFAVHSL